MSTRTPSPEFDIRTINAAVEKRRQKHKRITEELIAHKSAEEINHIILKSSGIDLIMANKDKLNRLFSSSETILLPQETLINEYIQDEKHKQRDEGTSTIPLARHNLLEVAQSIFKTREVKKNLTAAEEVILPKRSSSPEFIERKRSHNSQSLDKEVKILRPIARRSLDALINTGK